MICSVFATILLFLTQFLGLPGCQIEPNIQINSQRTVADFLPFEWFDKLGLTCELNEDFVDYLPIDGNVFDNPTVKGFLVCRNTGTFQILTTDLSVGRFKVVDRLGRNPVRDFPKYLDEYARDWNPDDNQTMEYDVGLEMFVLARAASLRGLKLQTLQMLHLSAIYWELKDWRDPAYMSRLKRTVMRRLYDAHLLLYADPGLTTSDLMADLTKFVARRELTEEVKDLALDELSRMQRTLVGKSAAATKRSSEMHSDFSEKLSHQFGGSFWEPQVKFRRWKSSRNLDDLLAYLKDLSGPACSIVRSGRTSVEPLLRSLDCRSLTRVVVFENEHPRVLSVGEVAVLLLEYIARRDFGGVNGYRLTRSDKELLDAKIDAAQWAIDNK